MITQESDGSMTYQNEPREFSLRKKDKPTLESDYDALEMSQEGSEYLAMMGGVLGLIHVIEKSAYSKLKVELESYKRVNEGLWDMVDRLSIQLFDKKIELQLLKQEKAGAK